MSRRPKRAGSDFRHASLRGDDAPSSSKKARFDARNPSTLAAEEEEEDPVLDLDEIGARSGGAKRNAVELDGYESDSSNDNFDRRARARADQGRRRDSKGSNAKAAKSKEEEDADMFADLEADVDGGGAASEDDDGEGGGKKKKTVRFMEAKDIEGQVASSKSGGHVSADFSLNDKSRARDVDAESTSESSGDEVAGEEDDELRDAVGEGEDEQELGAGAKKRHAPRLDAFNMKNEAEEGRFDESGNFIRNATDPFAVHDSWLADSSKSDMKRAREAQEKRDEQRRKRAMADDALSTGEILGALISRLQVGETVLEALARLNSTRDKKKVKFQKNRRKQAQDGMDVDREQPPQEDEAEIKRRETIEAITAAADQLLTRGQTEIYEAERELLMRQYKRETGEDWVDTAEDSRDVEGDGTKESNGHSAAKQWEYRWSDARDGGDAHGPYDGATMAAWSGAGYFGEGVEFREVGATGWNPSVEFA